MPMKEQDSLLPTTAGAGGDDGSGGNSGNENGNDTSTTLQQQQPQQHRRYQSVDTGSNPTSTSSSRASRMSRHRQHRSSIRELVVNNILEPIGEEFQTTGQFLTSSLVQRLDKLDHGNHTGFFDMSLSRSLSILPEDLSKSNILQNIVTGGGIGMEGETPQPGEEEDGEVHPLLKKDETLATTTTEVSGGGPPVIQYLALLGAVTAISSNSTALRFLVGVSPPLKLYWRMTASYVALLPFIVLNIIYKLQERREFFNQNKTEDTNKTDNKIVDTTTTTTTTSSSLSSSTETQQVPLPSTPQTPPLVTSMNVSEWITFGAAVLCYTVQNLLFYASLDYTTIGNAVIYANSQALLLIIAKACTGERIHPFEAVGVVVAFTGAILCSKDSESSENDQDDEEAATVAATNEYDNDDDATITLATQPSVPPIVGDAMALCAAVIGVGYLTFAKAVRPHMSVTVFMFSVLFCGSFLVLAYIAITDGEHLQFNMDPYTGVLGWFDEQRLPFVLYLAVVVNMVGTMGFVRAMQYFDNIVISVATLMEPLMASLIAYGFQIGLLPGPLGWIGNVLVIVGTLGVVYPSMGKGSGDGMH